MVILPGAEGMFSVLPRHAPMIVSLKAGLIKVFIDNIHDVDVTYLVSKGMTEVTANYINIVTETAIDVTSFSEAEIADKLINFQKST